MCQQFLICEFNGVGTYVMKEGNINDYNVKLDNCLLFKEYK